MSKARPRVRTTTIQLRVDPLVKAAAMQAAGLERRNLSNWIEVLILDRCKQLEIATPPSQPQES